MPSCFITQPPRKSPTAARKCLPVPRGPSPWRMREENLGAGISISVPTPKICWRFMQSLKRSHPTRCSRPARQPSPKNRPAFPNTRRRTGLGPLLPRPAADQPDEMEPVELQIYFPNRSEFLEISSLRRRYSPETRVSLTFPFHPPEELDWLRIDPGQFPGEYIIHEWSLLRADHTPARYWQNTYSAGPARFHPGRRYSCLGVEKFNSLRDQFRRGPPGMFLRLAANRFFRDLLVAGLHRSQTPRGKARSGTR